MGKSRKRFKLPKGVSRRFSSEFVNAGERLAWEGSTTSEGSRSTARLKGRFPNWEFSKPPSERQIEQAMNPKRLTFERRKALLQATLPEVNPDKRVKLFEWEEWVDWMYFSIDSTKWWIVRETSEEIQVSFRYNSRQLCLHAYQTNRYRLQASASVTSPSVGYPSG